MQQVVALLSDSISSIEFIDEAASIEFLNKLCTNESLGLEIGHGGIAQFHQTLHVVEAFRGRIRFSIRGTQQILVALLGEVGIGNFQPPRDGFDHRRFHARAERVGDPFEPCLQGVSHYIRLLGEVTRAYDNAVADKRNVGFESSTRVGKPRCFKSLLNALSTTVASIVPFSNAWLSIV